MKKKPRKIRGVRPRSPAFAAEHAKALREIMAAVEALIEVAGRDAVRRARIGLDNVKVQALIDREVAAGTVREADEVRAPMTCAVCFDEAGPDGETRRVVEMSQVNDESGAKMLGRRDGDVIEVGGSRLTLRQIWDRVTP